MTPLVDMAKGGSERSETAVTLPPSLRSQFQTETGYRWHILALNLEMNQHAPEWLDDYDIECLIAAQWEEQPPPFSFRTEGGPND